MAKLTLYTDARLPCPQRVHLVIEELGLDDIKFINLDVLKCEHKNTDFSRIHPPCSVPFLVDSTHDPSISLSESRAICRYLVTTNAAQMQLVPDAMDRRAMARFEEAASVEVTAFDPVANRLVFEAVFKEKFGQGYKDPLVIHELDAKLRVVLDRVDADLANKKYMAGENFTLVDIFYAPYMSKLVERQEELLFANRDNLKDWWSRVCARPSFRALRE